MLVNQHLGIFSNMPNGLYWRFHLHTPGNAGEWRQQLRSTASAEARLQALQRALAALSAGRDADIGCAGVLTALLTLLALHDGAILARRGERALVLAAQGRALPPGGSIPFELPGAAWWLPPRPAGSHDAVIAVQAPGRTVGLLCVGWQADQVPSAEDLALLPLFSALLPAWLVETSRPSRPRTATTVASARSGLLSARERQVLSLLPRGLTNAGLARELGIAPGTVKVHVERILQKLQLSDRTQAAVYAVQSGIAV
jgi:DNA-binding CsgD family transcriptional regulator